MAFEIEQEKERLAQSVAYALELFAVNCRNETQKKLGKQFLPFAAMFEVRQNACQFFDLKILPQKKARVFCERFVAVCEDFLKMQDEPIKQEYIKSILNDANALIL